jgi:hypothetical protein
MTAIHAPKTVAPMIMTTTPAGISTTPTHLMCREPLLPRLLATLQA